MRIHARAGPQVGAEKRNDTDIRCIHQIGIGIGRGGVEHIDAFGEG
jgi:hypothetical protein